MSDRVQECEECGGYGYVCYAPNCPTCNGTGEMRNRWRVACINWGHSTAPKAIAYRVGAHGAAERGTYFQNHAAAIVFADRAARNQNGENK